MTFYRLGQWLSNKQLTQKAEVGLITLVSWKSSHTWLGTGLGLGLGLVSQLEVLAHLRRVERPRMCARTSS